MAKDSMDFDQVVEVEGGGLVGQGAGQLQPHEPPHRVGLVEQVLHCGVAEVVEDLDAVDSQHHRQRIGMAAPSGLGIEELDAPSSFCQGIRPAARSGNNSRRVLRFLP